MYVMNASPAFSIFLIFYVGYLRFFSSSPVILSIRHSRILLSLELKNPHPPLPPKEKKKTNLVGLDEKSCDICRDSLLVMGEWVYHCSVYEWPQVCGREVGRQREGETDRRELYHFWVMSLWFRCAPFEEASLIHFGPWKPLSAGMWAGLGI